jgi:hypothetical protein
VWKGGKGEKVQKNQEKQLQQGVWMKKIVFHRGKNEEKTVHIRQFTYSQNPVEKSHSY